MSPFGVDRAVLVIQHAPWEGPGRIGHALAARGIAMHTRTLISQPAVSMPDLDRYAGVVVLGGPARATDTVAHPALAIERDLLRSAVDRDMPVLGICLGHQLLSLALGGELEPDAADEVGMGPLTLEGDGLVGAAGGLDVLHWHRDNASLPPGAELLASTPGCPNQAFRLGSALGLQFHLEVDAAMLERWLREASVRADLAVAPSAVMGAMQHAETTLRAAAETVFAGFAHRVVEY